MAEYKFGNLVEQSFQSAFNPLVVSAVDMHLRLHNVVSVRYLCLLNFVVC